MTTSFKSFLVLLLILLVQFVFISPQKAYAATAPDLGVASGYSVFGEAGLTETPAQNSHLWGNVGDNGLGHASLIASQVDGTLYSIGQPTIVSAKTSAYGDLAAEAQTGSIDLGGSPTVGPGVYNVGATAFNSTLTLSGDGVYIFRGTSSIAQVAGGTMLLTNGATSCNIYWQIPTSMTFGASGNIVGTIIASTGDITFVSGVNLIGRAWSHTLLTMDNNQITQPVCAAASTPTSSLTSAGAPSSYCPPLNNQIVAPSIIDSKRVSSTSIFISWGPYSGVNTFNVQYGTADGSWLYNTDVTGFSTTINALPINQPIWVRVAVRSDCTIGSYGQSKLVGGPTMPNTGFAPNERIVSWLIPVNVFSQISYLFSFVH
jgi:hypothetical protein